MDDNIIPEEETALLFDGQPEDHLQAQQKHLLQLLKPAFTRRNLNNYERKSESLKHLHDWTSIVTVIKRQNLSRKKTRPFLHNSECASKSAKRHGDRSSRCTPLAHTTLVALPRHYARCISPNSSWEERHATPAVESRPSTPTAQYQDKKASTLSLIRENLTSKSLLTTFHKSSYKPGTQEPRRSTSHINKDGNLTVVSRKLFSFRHLYS